MRPGFPQGKEQFLGGGGTLCDAVSRRNSLTACVEGEEVGVARRTEVDELSLPLTPDGGWGWMVVVASFVTNLLVDGVAYTFGIIMPALIDHFDASKGKTAVVGSLIPGLYNIVGMVIVALRLAALHTFNGSFRDYPGEPVPQR